jgi:hypothetical protein
VAAGEEASKEAASVEARRASQVVQVRRLTGRLAEDDDELVRT